MWRNIFIKKYSSWYAMLQKAFSAYYRKPSQNAMNNSIGNFIRNSTEMHTHVIRVFLLSVPICCVFDWTLNSHCRRTHPVVSYWGSSILRSFPSPFPPRIMDKVLATKQFQDGPSFVIMSVHMRRNAPKVYWNLLFFQKIRQVHEPHWFHVSCAKNWNVWISVLLHDFF